MGKIKKKNTLKGNFRTVKPFMCLFVLWDHFKGDLDSVTPTSCVPTTISQVPTQTGT